MFVCFFNSFTSVVSSVWAISQRYYTIDVQIIKYIYVPMSLVAIPEEEQQNSWSKAWQVTPSSRQKSLQHL